jgi:hypothetical protein
MNLCASAALALFVVGCSSALAAGPQPETPDLDAPTLSALVSGVAGVYAAFRIFRKRK